MSWRRLAVRRIVVRFSSTGFQPKVIETLPATLHAHLFGTKTPATAAQQDLSLNLPSLRGKDIVEHFRAIGSEHASPYLQLLQKTAEQFSYKYIECDNGDWTQNLAAESSSCTKFRNLSDIDWKFTKGWTRYSHEDGSIYSVPFPEEDVLIFDVEVCIKDGLLPTLAVALSDKAWYGWCSGRLTEDTPYPTTSREEHLIPIGGWYFVIFHRELQMPHSRLIDNPAKSRVVIGHNVGYDRSRVRDSYSKQKHKIRYMDTMSMSVSMFGMADHQQIVTQAGEEKRAVPKTKEWFAKQNEKTGWKAAWRSRVTKNGLKDVADFLLKLPMNKDTRGYFVKEDIQTIREHFQKLMRYCAEDNLATALIFSKMWPMFRQRFPEDITLCGMLTMADAYLPINQHWRDFSERNYARSNDSKYGSAMAVISSAQDLIKSSEKDANFLKSDPWMFCYAETDWFSKLFYKKKIANLVRELGPEWAAQEDVVAKSVLIPSIYGLVYHSYPLYKTKKAGWGYLAPRNKKKKARETVQDPIGINEKSLTAKCKELADRHGDVPLPEEVDIRFHEADFYKIPHPSGYGNVGDVISKSFYKQFADGTFRPTRFQEQFTQIIDTSKITKHWTSYNKRYEEEIDVYYDAKQTEGAMAPSIRPAGTVTRRSSHKLWVTLSNDSDEVTIGKGIKNMIQAPKGYKIVGADVDSQEQWLAAIFGDSSVAKILPEEDRYTGLTPFSNMMLAGSKSDGSDLHSVVARQLKINRHDAKVLNYARLYGSGQAHAEKALLRSLKPEEAKEVAANLFSLTKGIIIECRQLSSLAALLFKEFEKEKGQQGSVVVDGHLFLPTYLMNYSKPVVEFENWVLRRLGVESPEEQKTVLTLLYEDITKKKELYFNGYETATFNFLEQEAKKAVLRTPVLSCQITDALAKLPPGTPDEEAYDKKYRRSVMNWIVQSSAVDFLHLLLLAMNWLCDEYDIDARFVISIHDEVRYLCPDDEAPRVALALMLAHLYVRTFISHCVGFRQLPASVAFFSQVDCDTVLRKEVTTKCFNPDGKPIPPGVNWNIDDIIALTGGSLEKKSQQQRRVAL